MAKIEKPLIQFSNILICRNCQGKGYFVFPSHILQCDVCEGKGRVRVRKEIRVVIETI